MSKFFSNPWVQFGLVVLGITLFISAIYAIYDYSQKNKLETRLKRVDDTLATMRASDTTHSELLAIRTDLVNKVKGI